MDFVIPKTKVEAYAMLADRRFNKRPMLKYDMFLIGLVLCSDEEFEYRTYTAKYNYIFGFPCICKYCVGNRHCKENYSSCDDAAQETFAMKWDDKLGD